MNCKGREGCKAAGLGQSKDQPDVSAKRRRPSEPSEPPLSPQGSGPGGLRAAARGRGCWCPGGAEPGAGGGADSPVSYRTPRGAAGSLLVPGAAAKTGNAPVSRKEKLG